MDKAFVGKHTRYPDLTGNRVAEGGRRLRGDLARGRVGAPLVTIITVCWNSAKTIEQMIRSVMDQTYGNVEHLVIDGGSTDGTLDILRTYDASIGYFLSEPDEGLYHAMNKGLELAQGDYILMLNSDDWYQPDTVARLAAAMEYSGYDFAGALARYVNADGSSYVLRSMPFDHSVLLRMPLRHETMMIPATLYDRIGPYNTDYPIIADYEFTVRLFEAGATYYELRDPLLNFRTEGVSNTAKDRLDAEMRRLISRNFPFLTGADLLALTDHDTVGPMTFIDLANAHPTEHEFVRAVRSLLKERKLHAGKKWKEARLDALLSDPALGHPKVSVIIPVHNAGRFLGAAIDNILSQSLSEIEVICVDDASEDGSCAIVESLAAKDNRVRLLRNDINRGPGACRNRGIRAARGQHVFFLDADDAVPPGALKKLHDVAIKSGSVIVRGAFMASQSVHGQPGESQIKYAAGVSSDALLNTSLSNTLDLLRSTEGHWAALYDADFAQTILYPEDIRVGEDSQFIVRAFAHAKDVTVLPDVVYHYQANADSSMNKMTSAKYFDGLNWRRRAYHILDDAGFPRVAERLLFNFWSQPYFDGLERTLSNTEKQKYFGELRAVFAEAGQKGLRVTRDVSMRDRIRALMCEHTTADWPKDRRGKDTGPLRIATFSTQNYGGAGLGSQRRVEALRRNGVDARIYCAFQNEARKIVHKVPYAAPLEAESERSVAWQAWRAASVVQTADEPAMTARELFSKTGSIVDFRDLGPIFDSADIVHLHWVVGLFDFEHAEELADKPVVWTLADMNAFTGGCHYSEGCEGYKQECRKCPLLGGKSDLAHEAWKTKRAAYAKIKNLQIICPSEWLADCARSSSLFGDRPVHMIPNAFPVNRFTPTNKLVARMRLGLPLDKKLVVFGADSLDNTRKGGDILAESIRILQSRGEAENIEGVFFGAASLELGIESHNMGRVQKEKRLSLIYAAGDVFAFPSREDNAPLTVAESLLSGTPVVAFPVGNVPELIRHEDTGYIARYEDAEDFAGGLVWALAAPRSAAALARGMRGHMAARAHNDPRLSVARHLRLYESMLARGDQADVVELSADADMAPDETGLT